jgi:hypothetical protein
MHRAHDREFRNVNINFEEYGEDDPVFKAELIMLMIENIRELQDAGFQALDQKNSNIFHAAVHKTKSTIKLLDDPELINKIEILKENLNSPFLEILREKVNAFKSFGDVLIRSLEREAATLLKGSS